MTFLNCPDCGTSLPYLGKPHACSTKSSRGVAEGLVAPQTAAMGHSVPRSRETNSRAGRNAVERKPPITSGAILDGEAIGRTAGSNPATGAKRGRPRVDDPTPTKPWIALGLTERTYYRRQKAKRDE